ncbi:MAG: hypothetical protein HZB31_08990 [Nitrospirae bacterium]|nr:hypothetical protein [Nitrospirota bacterium]
MQLIISIVFLCCVLFPAYPPALAATDTPDCSIDLGPCSSAVSGRQVTFDITPRPVRTMKELTFTVSGVGRISAPTLLLDISMPGMYMGRNEVILKKSPDGAFRGKGIIPRCPSGKKLWRAAVTIPGAGKVSYTFHVSQ